MNTLLNNKDKIVSFFKSHLAKHAIVANKYTNIDALLNLADFKYDSDKVQNGKFILYNLNGAFTAYITSDFDLDSSTIAYIKNTLYKFVFNIEGKTFAILDDKESQVMSGKLAIKHSTHNLSILCLTAGVAFDTVFKSEIYDLDILRLHGHSLFESATFDKSNFYLYKNEDFEVCLIDINNKSCAHADTTVKDIDEDHFILSFIDNKPVISQLGLDKSKRKFLTIKDKIIIDTDLIFYDMNLYFDEYGRLHICEKSILDNINMYARGNNEIRYGQNILVFDTCNISICANDESTGIKLAREAVINCNDNYNVVFNNTKINAKYYNEGVVMYDELIEDQELTDIDELDAIEPELNVWKNLIGSNASNSTLNDSNNPRVHERSIKLSKAADQDKPVAICQTFKVTPNKVYALTIHRKCLGIASEDLKNSWFGIFAGNITDIEQISYDRKLRTTSQVAMWSANRAGYYRQASTEVDTYVNSTTWAWGPFFIESGNNEYLSLVLYCNSKSGQVNFGPITVNEYDYDGLIYAANTDMMLRDTDINVKVNMADFAKSKMHIDSINTAADKTKVNTIVDSYAAAYYSIFIDGCGPQDAHLLARKPFDDAGKLHMLCMDSVNLQSFDMVQAQMYGIIGESIKSIVQRCKLQIDNQWVSKYSKQYIANDYDYQLLSPTATSYIKYSWNYWKDNYISANSASGYDGGCGSMWSNTKSHNWIVNIEAHGMRDGLTCSTNTYFLPDGTYKNGTYYPDGSKVDNFSYNYIKGGFVSSPGHGGIYAAGSARQVKPDMTIDKTNGRSEGIKWNSTKVYVMDCDVCWRVKPNESRYTGAAGTYCGYGTDTWFDNCTVGLRTSPGYSPGGTIVLNNRGSSEIKKGTQVFFSNSYNKYGFRNDPNSTTYIGKGCSGKLTGTNTTASGGKILNTDEVYRIEVPQFPF